MLPDTPPTAFSKSTQMDLFLPETITATKNNIRKVSALLSCCSLEMSGWRGAGPNSQASGLTRWQSNHVTQSCHHTEKASEAVVGGTSAPCSSPSSWSMQQQGYRGATAHSPPIQLLCNVTQAGCPLQDCSPSPCKGRPTDHMPWGSCGSSGWFCR